MKRTSQLLFALLLALAAACSDDRTVPVAPETTRGVEVAAAETGDNHIVVFKSRIPASFADHVAALDGEVLYASAAIGAAWVAGLDDAAAAELAGDAGVKYVEREPILPLELPTEVTEAEAVAEPASPENPAGAFFFARQWHLRAIHADQAWAAGRLGSPAVTVAILDTGIDYLHADLAGRVDLSRSASFVAADDALVAQFFPARHPITDLHWHGTHVSATVSSNALAAAGVTSGVTLIGGKVCSVFGTCPGGSVFAGIDHAITNGADIVNMSLGGEFRKRDFPGFVSVINRLFNRAKTENVTMVVAAGNDATDLDRAGDLFVTYCNAPHVICVSATGPTFSPNHVTGPWTNPDAPAPYTNFGRSAIWVAAPGGTGFGFVWAACSSSSLVIPICQTGTFVLGAAGTSMATPHASGVASFLVEDLGKNASLVRDALKDTADDLGPSGNDPFYGRGRVNAARAVGL